MRGRWPPLVMLGGGLVFLASLYLPWRSPRHGVGDLLGWSAGPSYAAALLALALVIGAAVAIARPSLAARLPLGGLGVSLAYFTAAVAVQVSQFSFPASNAPVPVGFTVFGALHYSWSYGVYLAGASGTAAGLAALALRREELLRHRTAAEAAAAVLGLGLLISFLLPWEEALGANPGGFTAIGLASPAAMIAAAGLILAAGRLRTATHPVRLTLATMAAVLTGAAASGQGLDGRHAYGTWVGIGCVVALFALEAGRMGLPLPRLEMPQSWAGLVSGGAVLLLLALFLPWQVFGLPHGHGFGTDGWEAIFGAVAGTLALLLLAAPILPWVTTYTLEAALGIALLIATYGVGLVENANYRFIHVGSGSYGGFVGAGLVLLGVLGPLRWPSFDRRRMLVRAVPVLASLACVGAVVVPAWQGVLPLDWTFQADAVHSWFAVAVLLLALYLFRSWIGQIERVSAGSVGLVLAPLFILPLPALELIHDRASGVAWGGVILIGLSVLLAALGWIEQRGGLENFRFPEILRLDRLPEAKA